MPTATLYRTKSNKIECSTESNKSRRKTEPIVINQFV